MGLAEGRIVSRDKCVSRSDEDTCRGTERLVMSAGRFVTSWLMERLHTNDCAA